MKRKSFHAPATILPFYESINEQYRFASPKGQDYKLYADPYNAMLPFQIFIPRSSPTDDVSYSWYLMNLDGTEEFDLEPAGAPLYIAQVAGIGLWAINPGNNDDGTWTPEGYYYYKVMVAGKTLYSEVFYVPCLEEWYSLNKIRWRNKCDMLHTLYHAYSGVFTYYNKFYFEGETEKGRSIIEEEIDSNEFGQEIKLLTGYKDSFEITDVVPFYLQESIALLRTHSVIQAIHLKGLMLQESDMQVIEVTESDVEWFDEDRFKGRMVLHVQSNDMIKTACCQNFVYWAP